MGNDMTQVNQALTQFIGQQEDSFLQLNDKALNTLSFVQEQEFARQQLVKNTYTLDVARNNKPSLRDAISNVASIGLSLNPAYSHAYLVPRKINKVACICLDISYRGLIKLATDTGVIEYMKAEIVYENDDFNYEGFNVKPTLKANPFKDRGNPIGCYAMAKLRDSGDCLVEVMTWSEIMKIRDDSEAYKSAINKGQDSWNYKNCVWVKYEGEMVKKTVIKRLYKTLPQTNGMNHLGNAIDVINQHEGIDFNEPKEVKISFSEYQSSEYKRCLDESDFTGLLSLIETLDHETYVELQNLHEYMNLPKGNKGKHTKMMEEHFKTARELREDNFSCLLNGIQENDEITVSEIVNECNAPEFDYYMRKLNPEQQGFVNSVTQVEAA